MWFPPPNVFKSYALLYLWWRFNTKNLDTMILYFSAKSFIWVIVYSISLETYCCSDWGVKHAILRGQFVLIPRIEVDDKSEYSGWIQLWKDRCGILENSYVEHSSNNTPSFSFQFTNTIPRTLTFLQAFKFLDWGLLRVPTFWCRL